jgi:hypothetical protein
MLAGSMDNWQERRRYPRYDTGRLPGRLDGTHPCFAVKLGGGGALLQVDEELALEQRVHLALDLGRGTFHSDAVVVFVGPELVAGRPATYRIGLSFTDTPPAEHELLQRFIGNLGGGQR